MFKQLILDSAFDGGAGGDSTLQKELKDGVKKVLYKDRLHECV